MGTVDWEHCWRMLFYVAMLIFLLGGCDGARKRFYPGGVDLSETPPPYLMWNRISRNHVVQNNFPVISTELAKNSFDELPPPPPPGPSAPSKMYLVETKE